MTILSMCVFFIIYFFFSDVLEESDKTKLKNFVCQLSSQKNFIWFAVMNLIQVSRVYAKD